MSLGQKKQPSFKSIPIYNINVKKLDRSGKYIFTPAVFSKLDPKNAEDQLAFSEISTTWSYTTFGMLLDLIFKKSKEFVINDFYTVELDDQVKSLSNKILSIISTSWKLSKNNPKKILKIEYLQASPDIVYSKTKDIKGAGELGMYGVIKKAQEEGADGIQIFSTNNEFYQNIGDFQVLKTLDNGSCYFYLDKSQFDKFLERIDNKYNLK